MEFAAIVIIVVYKLVKEWIAGIRAEQYYRDNVNRKK